MSHIAEFTLPPRAFPAGAVLEEWPDLRIEVERFVPTAESIMPFFWAWGGDVDSFLADVRGDDDLTDVDVLDRVDGGALYRATWRPKAEIRDALVELDATVLDAVGTHTSWFVRLRAQESRSFVAFHDVFEAHGMNVGLEKLYEIPEDAEGHYYQLTPTQRETIITAYEEGYFDEPRGVTQAELGDRFGVSGRAVSTRLRRGMKTLVANALLTATDRPAPWGEL